MADVSYEKCRSVDKPVEKAARKRGLLSSPTAIEMGEIEAQ